MSRALDWRIALASATGRSHLGERTPCQDAFACTMVHIVGAELLVAAASDGAGSREWSQVGADIACHAFLDETATRLHARGNDVPLDYDTLELIAAALRDRIECAALERGLSREDLACTFLGAVVAPAWSIFCQVGDGAIVVQPIQDVGEATFELVFEPERGKYAYANETFFITDEGWRAHLQLRLERRPLGALVLLTDGLQTLVLEDGREPFQRWFAKILRPLWQGADGDGGMDPALSAELARYLASPMVADRTHDDVTLVLARRRNGGGEIGVAAEDAASA